MTTPIEQVRAALLGRYEVARELGSGGMATVFQARDPRHGRDVAIKVLHPAIASSVGSERFLREIRIAGGLTHPNLVPLLDSGESDGLLFYVMPLVSGASLRERIDRQGELPVDEAVTVLCDLLEALAYAHDRGIVHRDVKPENVLMVGPRAQLADFGIAKAVAEATGMAVLTATGMVVGTPAYIAPEQAAGDGQVDHRADLYAAGIVGYELLTGSPPFGGASPQQLMVAHLTRPVEPVGSVRPTVPAAVAEVVMRALEKRPADRWQSAEEMLRRLREAGPSGGGTMSAGPTVVAGELQIDETVWRRIDRRVFDARMIGDRLRYLDNQVPSDVLVLLVSRWGLEAAEDEDLLGQIPFRAVIPTLFGFDTGRKVRFALGVSDHLVMLEHLLGDLTRRIAPKHVVLVGFSAGGDLMLRLAAGAAPESRIDGCLTLGSNLGRETCFATGVLATVTSGAPEVVLPAMNAALGAASTVGDWVALGDYLVRILRSFGADLGPIREFARGIVEPWTGTGLEPFIEWYRKASARGCRLRCVFEDNDSYRDQVRSLQLLNLDRGVFGPDYRPGSIVVEPVAGHFDLIEPELLLRQLRSLVAELRSG